MRWHLDKSGAEWTATVTPSGDIRLLRRKLSKPYREGDEPSKSYESYVLDTESAAGLAVTVESVVTSAENG